METFTKLGGNRRLVDSRDKKFLGSATLTPTQVINKDAFLSPIYYQGQRPACGAHAGIWLARLLTSVPSYTPRFTWIDIKKNGADKNPSDGTDMRSIFASLLHTGVDDFQPLGNDVSLDDATYASASAVTQEMLDTALKTCGFPYHFLDTVNFDTLKSSIAVNKGELILMQVGDSMWTAKDGTTSWAEKDVLPLRPPTPVVDGHFVTCHSYLQITELELGALESGLLSLGNILKKYAPDVAQAIGFDEVETSIQTALLTSPSAMTSGIVIFANSWGASWGFRGHGYFSENYMPFVLEAGSISLPNPSPLPQNTPVETTSVPSTPTTPPTPENVPETNIEPSVKSQMWYISLWKFILSILGILH